MLDRHWREVDRSDASTALRETDRRMRRRAAAIVESVRIRRERIEPVEEGLERSIYRIVVEAIGGTCLRREALVVERSLTLVPVVVGRRHMPTVPSRRTRRRNSRRATWWWKRQGSLDCVA